VVHVRGSLTALNFLRRVVKTVLQDHQIAKVKEILLRMPNIDFFKKCFVVDVVCYQPGKCVATPIAETNEMDEFNCKTECRRNPRCQWFTYEIPTKQCQLFPECGDMNFDTSSTTVSGQRQCGDEPREFRISFLC